MKRARLTKEQTKDWICGHEHVFNKETGEMYEVEDEDIPFSIADSNLLYYVPRSWYPVFRGSRYIGYYECERFRKV